VRARRIAPAERAEAERAYEEARTIYRRIAAESPSRPEESAAMNR
jgi:hypothetical protein